MSTINEEVTQRKIVARNYSSFYSKFDVPLCFKCVFLHFYNLSVLYNNLHYSLFHIFCFLSPIRYFAGVEEEFSLSFWNRFKKKFPEDWLELINLKFKKFMSNENGQEYEEKDGKSVSQHSFKILWFGSVFGQSQLINN